jgi:hypothetical protein
MAVNSDFRDLFAALNAAAARYLLVGGYAVAFHAEPRFTRDLDVWIEPSVENAGRVIIQFGIAPNRIDVVTGIDGVDFEAAWKERVSTAYGDQQITVISRAHLIQNKRAAGRPQDLLDLELLDKHA